jgi:hypothetical protein
MQLLRPLPTALQDCLNHAVHVLEDIVIPEADYAIPPCFQVASSPAVGSDAFGLAVLPAVKFDN